MRFLCRIGIHSYVHVKKYVGQYKDTGNHYIHNFWECKYCKKYKVKN